MKSAGSTPLACRYLPAGESVLIEPAGEMWSVVIESPNSAMMRAPLTEVGAGAGCCVKPSKNGGRAM